MKERLINKGFTLIELLITITIVGILSGIVAISFINPSKMARDTTRKSDIKQYQTLLENYANRNAGLYVATSGSVELSSYCSGSLGSTGCPDDPTTTEHYKINSSTTTFVMWAKLEKPVQYFIVCSSGKSGLQAGEPPSPPTCPL